MDVLLRTRVPPEVMPVFLIILFPLVIRQIVREVRFLLRVRHCTELIPGEVTSLAEVSRGRHGSRFSPNIRYTCTGRDGEEHTDFYETEHSYPYAEYSVGMTVHLFIDPADGTNVYLAGEKQDAWRQIFVMIGIFLFLILATAACIAAQ